MGADRINGLRSTTSPLSSTSLQPCNLSVSLTGPSSTSSTRQGVTRPVSLPFLQTWAPSGLLETKSVAPGSRHSNADNRSGLRPTKFISDGAGWWNPSRLMATRCLPGVIPVIWLSLALNGMSSMMMEASRGQPSGKASEQTLPRSSSMRMEALCLASSGREASERRSSRVVIAASMLVMASSSAFAVNMLALVSLLRVIMSRLVAMRSRTSRQRGSLGRSSRALRAVASASSSRLSVINCSAVASKAMASR